MRDPSAARWLKANAMLFPALAGTRGGQFMDFDAGAQAAGMGASLAISDAPQPLERVRERASVSFDAVYEGNFGYVWNCVRRLGVPDKDIEDACHDVFVAVYKHLGEYDPARPIKPWLTGICYRVAANHRRKAPNRREIAQDDFSMIPDQGSHAEQHQQERQQRELVARALETLDEPRRTVLLLHDVEGHSVPDIAGILHEPLGTLYSRLRTARIQFAQAVKTLLGVGGAP